MKVGDQICWATASSSPEAVREGTVTRIQDHPGRIESLCWVDNFHKPEDCLYQAYCYPLRVKGQLVEALRERARLKTAYEDSIGLLFKIPRE